MYTYIKSKFWKHWSICLVLVASIGCLMIKHHCFHVPNLIMIEFAPDAQSFSNLVHPYTSLTCNTLYNNTLLDFGFMLAYTLLFYFSARVLWDLLEFSNHKLLLIFCLPLVFDAIENLLILQMLSTDIAHHLSFCTYYWAVRIKWALAIPGIILVIVVLMYQAYVGIDKIYCWWKKREE